MPRGTQEIVVSVDVLQRAYWIFCYLTVLPSMGFPTGRKKDSCFIIYEHKNLLLLNRQQLPAQR